MTDSTRSRSSAAAWALATVATLTMAVSYADRQALAVLAPVVTSALNIDDTLYGWLLSAFSVAYLIGAPLGGRWVDRVGARRGLTISVLVWSGIAALHAVVPGVLVLFALRIALGFAEAPSFPGAAQTVHRALQPADRPRGFGLLFVGSSVGAMLVPPLAGWLAHRHGFRAAFLGTAIIGLSWLPLWLVATRSRSTRALLAPAPVVAGPTTSIVVWLRHPAVIRGLIVIVAAAPLMSYGLNWSSKYLAALFHMDPGAIGHKLWLPPVLYDLGSIGFGFAASSQLRRLGMRAPPPRLLVACSCCLALVMAAIHYGQSPWAGTVLIGVATAGGGGLFALVTADLLSRVPASAVSTCAGLGVSAQSLAYIVASPLIGWSVQFHGHAATQVALAAWVVPGCVAWLLWSPPARVDRTTSDASLADVAA